MTFTDKLEKYKGKTVVIKYGGAAMESPELEDMVMADVSLLAKSGIRLTVVHGGGKELTNLLKKTGKESVFVDGLRVTDEETRDYALMVFCGKLNKELVNKLCSHGARGVGISGVDASLMTAVQKDERLGYVGKVEKTDSSLLDALMDNFFVPVVSSMGRSAGGDIYNINADTAAGSIASSLKADVLIMMTDICGICRDKNDESTLIRNISVSEVEKLRSSGIITGGMIPKTECCVGAINNGVEKVYIIDGRKEHSILESLLCNGQNGTVFTK